PARGAYAMLLPSGDTATRDSVLTPTGVRVPVVRSSVLTSNVAPWTTTSVFASRNAGNLASVTPGARASASPPVLDTRLRVTSVPAVATNTMLAPSGLHVGDEKVSPVAGVAIASSTVLPEYPTV